MARNNIKTTKKTYTRLCSECSEVTVSTKAKQKTTLCGSCSRKLCHKPRQEPIRYNLNTNSYTGGNHTMRYFRICPHCPEGSNTKEVQSAKLCGISPCRKHKYIDNPEALASKEAKRLTSYTKTTSTRPKKPKIKTSNLPSKKAIEKIVAINRAHREENLPKNKVIPKQKLSNKQMIDIYLQTHTVVAEETLDFNMGGTLHIQHSYSGAFL